MRLTCILTAACIATVVLIAAVSPSTRIPGAPIKVHAQNGGCSVASLQGAYAYRRTGIINDLGPIAQIGISTFNGDGTLGGGRFSSSRNGEIQDWTDVPPSGSYTVDPDCTGAIFDASGTKTQNFIVLDGGQGFFLMTTTPGRIATTEGKRLGTDN